MIFRINPFNWRLDGPDAHQTNVPKIKLVNIAVNFELTKIHFSFEKLRIRGEGDNTTLENSSKETPQFANIFGKEFRMFYQI